MKTNKIINAILGIALMLMAACAPIENRDVLKNSYHPDDIIVSVTHSSPGSNIFTLKMSNPGIIGHWDYTIGRAVGKGDNQEIQVVYPLMGKQTFRYLASSRYITNGDISNSQFIIKEIEVDIMFLEENSVRPEWTYLVGTDSKTWVFDKDAEHGGFFMTGRDDPFNMWWDPYQDYDGPYDNNGRMIFSLIGTPTFTSYASPTAEAVGNTVWYINNDWTELRLVGDANILSQTTMAPALGNPQTYRIVELTENRLVLWSRRFNASLDEVSGWTWIFKPLE
jgi:hypothetical protein